MQTVTLIGLLQGLISQTQLDAVDGMSRSLERGGLYTVCAIFLGFAIYLYIAKERLHESKEKERKELHAEFQGLQKLFQDKLLQVVETQTTVLTRQVTLTENVEKLLTRVTMRLEQRKED